jgi:hypothetical protein
MNEINSRFVKNLTMCFFIISLFSSYYSQAQENNPTSQYIINGKAVAEWKIYTGNAKNYFVPLVDGHSITERKSLIVSPLENALNIKWTGKKVKNEWGGNQLNDSFFSVGRNKIDISSVEDAAALAFEVKVLRSPSENVTLSMQCENSNKCMGKFPIKHILKKFKKDTWQQVPIPLNCFNKEEQFNFKKVTNILSIATQGKLEIQIRNVQLVGLQPGNKGCKA